VIKTWLIIKKVPQAVRGYSMDVQVLHGPAERREMLLVMKQVSSASVYILKPN